MATKEQLEQEMCVAKSNAYDVLANLEFLSIQYKKQSEELQKKLGEINGQIASKDQQLRSLVVPVKEEKQLLTEEK